MVRSRAQRQAFAEAVEEFTAEPNAAKPIATMMRLATEGVQAPLRGWAAQWLRAKCNIAVVTDELEGAENATAAQAEGLLR